MSNWSHDVPQLFDYHESRGGARCMHVSLLIVCGLVVLALALVLWRWL